MKTQNQKSGKAESTTIQKKNYLDISPKDIIVDEKENPREDYGDVKELMKSIVENGVRNPVKCFMKDEKVYLREGFRRMRAIKMAAENGHEIHRIPVIMEERPMSKEERTLEFLINNDGKPFTMLEQSEVINRLLNFGWKITEIEKRTGKARGYIEVLVDLTKLPVKVKDYIKAGKISAHAVVQIIASHKNDPNKLIAVVEEAIKTAAEEGKQKATPKHIKTKEAKSQSFGKFYKWAVTIADALGAEGVIKERAEVLERVLVAFENGKTAAQFAEEFFFAKNAKKK